MRLFADYIGEKADIDVETIERWISLDKSSKSLASSSQSFKMLSSFHHCKNIQVSLAYIWKLLPNKIVIPLIQSF